MPELTLESERSDDDEPQAAFRIGTFAVAAATIIVVSALIASGGDPEAMSLGMLAAIILVSPFAIMAPQLPHDRPYRAAMGITLGTTFVFFWIIGAVGVLGTNGQHPNDVMYLMVPVVGMIGAVAARLRPRGMARTLVATALAQILVPVVVVVAGLNLVPVSTTELLAFTTMMNGPFAALYLGSAWLFRKAAPDQVRAQ